jgi:hypothetical protein
VIPVEPLIGELHPGLVLSVLLDKRRYGAPETHVKAARAPRRM